MHSLRTAHHIAESLAEAGVPDEPVVLDRRGPHRSLAALDRLLADAIDEAESEKDATDGVDGVDEADDTGGTDAADDADPTADA
ncbi:hypothetical protein [Actinomycetospora cinnamomea]|uniref:hypothetical protein n=1 Tax=Actinomycetospora cinnamomea TaxID=663609 RepID=UPI0010580194|nr:hypothetical protein [Actinomycetospora cinnamomea]